MIISNPFQNQNVFRELKVFLYIVLSEFMNENCLLESVYRLEFEIWIREDVLTFTYLGF